MVKITSLSMLNSKDISYTLLNVREGTLTF